MKKINYITTQSLDSISGGWNGINYRLFENLSSQFAVDYIGPVNPKITRIENGIERMRKLITGKRKFNFYSDKRLNQIESLVNAGVKNEATFNLFLGQTPWVKCRNFKPYGSFIDVCFPTYVETYLKIEHFSEKDINRISLLEREWLKNAKHLFFTSSWTMNDANSKLGIDGSTNQHVVKLGGNIKIPETDVYDPGESLSKINLLFIALKFLKKGGIACWKAFQKLREKYPFAELHIIGERPPENVLATEGVVFHGKLSKTNPDELLKFEQIVSDSTVLIHPTEMDATPTVIIEAAYFGCPAVAPRIFGIPDLIKDGKTGILLDTISPESICNTIEEMISDNVRYEEMRFECRKNAVNEMSWNAVAKKIHAIISEN